MMLLIKQFIRKVEWTKVFLSLNIMGSVEDVSLHSKSIKRKLNQTLKGRFFTIGLTQTAVIRKQRASGILLLRERWFHQIKVPFYY